MGQRSERPEWAQQLWAARRAHALSPIKAAEALRAIDPTQPADLQTLADYIVKRWESGKHLPSAHNRQQLCALYGDASLFAGVPECAPAAPSIMPAAAPIVGDNGNNRVEDQADVLNRRAMLQALTSLAIGLPVSRVATEATRHGLMQALGRRDGTSPDEWAAIAFQYTRDFYTIAPSELLPEITTDLLVLGHMIETERNGGTIDQLRQAASQLCVVAAMGLAELGRIREAQRWWRNARFAADQSTNKELQVWARDWEAVNGLYERKPIPDVMRLTDEASAIGGDIPCSGTAGVLAGRAQALGLIGDKAESREALVQLESITERLPLAVTNDESSMFGWPEYRFRYTESYVYSHIGETSKAYAAQDRALDLYPPELAKERARLQFHRARCLIADGDIHGGLAYALDVLDGLAPMCKNELLYEVGRELITALPPSERTQPTATAFRNQLSPIGTPELPGSPGSLND